MVWLGWLDMKQDIELIALVIAEWLASRKQLPPPGPTGHSPTTATDLTLNEMFVAYWDFVEQYYRKKNADGVTEPTSGPA